MITALILGGGVAIGFFFVARGLHPPPLPLASLLQHQGDGVAAFALDNQPTGWLETRFGGALVEFVQTIGVDIAAERRLQDLRVTGRSMVSLATEKVGFAAVGAGPLVAGAIATLAGVRLPLSVILVVALALSAVGFFLPDRLLQADAEARRKQLVGALSAYLDLVAISLAGGSGPQGAMEAAADAGDGWAFQMLGGPVRMAQQRGRPPWDELRRLGQELGVDELLELAGSLSLAGGEGARVRQSLTARAESLRSRRLAEAEAEAGRATERMAVPLIVLGLGFVLFIGYAAVQRVFTGLG